MKRSIIYIVIICLLFSGCEGNTIKEYNNDAQANFDALWEILDEYIDSTIIKAVACAVINVVIFWIGYVVILAGTGV